MVLKRKPLTLALARPDTIIYMVQYNYKVYVHRTKLFLRNCIYIYIFFFLAVLYGLQDLSSCTRDQTCDPAVKTHSPNHFTARAFPMKL